MAQDGIRPHNRGRKERDYAEKAKTKRDPQKSRRRKRNLAVEHQKRSHLSGREGPERRNLETQKGKRRTLRNLHGKK
ncbi:hypothetical protein EUGRSUZ_D01974 [Eucalyptus grandis]|uniref:Uncharacterized protein n=2 Tax=Eucalyptus grandis TaxID=71139 RepID=A0ACC3L6Z8_EUCGR|nr:hypothetical protein EUGRSUZ_D01974 [Eucalyptus grandis]